jgi:hypothetical protein
VTKQGATGNTCPRPPACGAAGAHPAKRRRLVAHGDDPPRHRAPVQSPFASFRRHFSSFRRHFSSFRRHFSSFRRHFSSFRSHFSSFRLHFSSLASRLLTFRSSRARLR